VISPYFTIQLLDFYLSNSQTTGDFYVDCTITGEQLALYKKMGI